MSLFQVALQLLIKLFPKISQKMLTHLLRELMEDGVFKSLTAGCNAGDRSGNI